MTDWVSQKGKGCGGKDYHATIPTCVSRLACPMEILLWAIKEFPENTLKGCTVEPVDGGLDTADSRDRGLIGWLGLGSIGV